ncbi:hypothetical protein ABID19_006748 [Mesorhizobium robiniae]|uniref:Uncharacterized protein n=1 Tax=Mesorhizobium robiniae TaxID=559315 RepID=A0ABV2GZG9_9HYPH
MLGFKSLVTTGIILFGIEMVHMMRKRQARYAFNPTPSLAPFSLPDQRTNPSSCVPNPVTAAHKPDDALHLQIGDGDNSAETAGQAELDHAGEELASDDGNSANRHH